VNNRDLALGAVVVAAAMLGGMAGRFFYASDLAQCRNRVYAAELTQQGSQKMMEGCLDMQETLDVCELGQQAAEKVMDDLKHNETILRLRIMVLEKRCPADDSQKEDGA
jgi:hypothetical protein